MNQILKLPLQIGPLEMNKAFCQEMVFTKKAGYDIIVMDADLLSAIGMQPFKESFPEAVVDCGIQEANMMGVAAGLSLEGKIPFVHSFASFVSRRAFDQTYLSGAYARLGIKIIGSDPGITAATNGGTHQCYEDMALMRTVPGMTVLEPADAAMAKGLVRQMADSFGMYYMRLYRKPMYDVYSPSAQFQIGKAIWLRTGSDVTIVCSGICVADSLFAADMLAASGISASVVNVFTWKPLDEQALIQAAQSTGALVTAENHNVVNGLGAAVSSLLAKTFPVPMEMIGIQDEFGEVGDIEYLKQRYRLTASDIADAARRAVLRKG